MKKIKVLFTIPNFDTAGSGKALLNIALGLDKSLFEVEILCKHERGEFYKIVEQSGLKIHLFEYETQMKSIFRGIIGCWKVSRNFKEIKPDIIYSYHYSSDYSEALAAFFARIPWIYVKKNMSWYGPSQNSWYLRSFLAKKIIIQNSDMQKDFLRKFANKLEYVSIGVDTNKFYPMLKRRTTDQFVFIHISSLLPIKGIDILLKAYNILRKRSKVNTQLLIIGPDRSEYIEHCKNKYYADSVFFLGVQKEINEYLNVAHCFIQPSIKGEGSPIALQEAMSAGLVCIGSRVAGVNDQLKNYPEFQYEPNDQNDLAEIMNKVLKYNLNEINSIGYEMRQIITRNYSLEREIEQIEQILINLCK